MTTSAATADPLLRQTSYGLRSTQAGGLATQTLDVLFQVRLGSSRLLTPVSRRDSTVSRRTVMNKAD